ncbi:benzoate 4-monooxygenase cytochrome p450 [Niveomyces insectorum RCEF 264]|uniref:Benzoate 4-monooxygenase cytochrome p450 n=1 Tax=Niveomyces insectorum RCEF 264 TaxID=1081102 RepID=A0A162J3T6_9HYPO|nr:benzoate 4-monooxygenase cytochrome p450 [Niveomyces insectorum RCEF 264]
MISWLFLRLAAAAAILATVVVLVKRLFSPLAAVPGPRLALISSLPLKYHEFRGNRTRYVHSLHQKYGKAVRLAPHEVAFASVEAMREIYMSRGSGYDKTAFYHLFKQYNTPTMFSTLDRERHSQRRRIVADRYANTNVMREHSVHGLEERARSFTAKCREAPDQVVDIYIYLHCYAFDGVTHHLFHPYGSNSINEASDEAIMREVSFDNSLVRRLLEYYNPSLGQLADMLGLLPPARKIPRARAFVLDAAQQSDTADFTLTSRLRDPKFGLRDIDVAAECLDHMAAGIETTGDALCWTMWLLSLEENKEIQRRLREELLVDATPSLPFLEAVIKEGLRLFPSIPMSLPRVVPAGGREVDGYWLPGGTIVSCQPYSLQRCDDKVFPQPDMFMPERWLADDGGDAERNRLFFAFSSGGRGCLGRHLAMAEMKVLLRDVYSQFTTTLPEEMTSDMSMSDQIISSRPQGQCCLLKFTPVEN